MRRCRHKACVTLLSVYNPGELCGLHERDRHGVLIDPDYHNLPVQKNVLKERERRVVARQVKERELRRPPANPSLTGDDDDREDGRSRWMTEPNRCSQCFKEPRYVGNLGKRCYEKEWRKSQGEGSRYRERARVSSARRVS